jgi:hypothetical protein
VRRSTGRPRIAAARRGVEGDAGELVVARVAVVADSDREGPVRVPEPGKSRVGSAEDRALGARRPVEVAAPGAGVRGERIVGVLDAGLGHVSRPNRLAVVPRDLRLEGARREKRQDQPGQGQENHQGEHERDAVFVVDEPADSAHGERLRIVTRAGQLRVTSMVITSSRRS